MFFCVLCFSCFRICSLLLVVTCLERVDLLALVGDVYSIFVTFPGGILGQVWYLIVSFPDLCRLSYFATFAMRGVGVQGIKFSSNSAVAETG